MILFEQFNSEIVVNLIYILAAMLFIFGLKMLGSPETARRGNLVSASGMFLAVVVTHEGDIVNNMVKDRI